MFDDKVLMIIPCFYLCFCCIKKMPNPLHLCIPRPNIKGPFNPHRLGTDTEIHVKECCLQPSNHTV